MPKPWELDFVGGGSEAESLGKPWERTPTEESTQPPPLPSEMQGSEAGFLENFGKGAVSGTYDVGTALYSSGEAAFRPIGGTGLSFWEAANPFIAAGRLFAPETTKSVRDWIAESLSSFADQSSSMSEAVLETGEYAKGLTTGKFDRGADPDSWGVTFGKGATSVLPIMAASAATGGAAAIPAVGVYSFGSTFHEAKAAYSQQGMSEEEASSAAMLPALSQASVDMVLTKAGGVIAGKFGGANIENLTRSVRSSGFKDGVNTLAGKTGLKIKHVVKGGLTEGAIEEAPAQFIGDYLIARHTYDPEVTLETAAAGAWKSFVVGAGLGGGMGMLQKVQTPEDIAAAAATAAKRDVMRDIAPSTAAKLDEKDAASLVLPDEDAGSLEPMVIEGEAPTPKPIFPQSARDKVVNEAKEKGQLPLWWDRYEGTTEPDGSTVPSGLRYADQKAVNRFIEEQEAYNELSQFTVEQHPDFDGWAVFQKGELVAEFETEARARKEARQMALNTVPKKVQARIKGYQQLTQKLSELAVLDQSYQQQLDLSKKQTTQEEAAAPAAISTEDQAFVAQTLGITPEDLQYSGLNITQEMVDQLRFAPESGIKQFLKDAEDKRQIDSAYRSQREAAQRAEDIKAERDRAEAEAFAISAKMRLEEDSRTLSEARQLAQPQSSQQLGQLAEEQLVGTKLNTTERTILNKLLDRKAALVADSVGITDPQQTENFIESIDNIDTQIASLLETPPPPRITSNELTEMRDFGGEIATETEVVPEPEPVATIKVGDAEVKVVNRTGPVEGVANAADPAATATEIPPAVLKQLEKALANVAKRFGSLLNLSEVQLTTLNGGAGLASMARTGVTDSILVDTARLTRSMSNKKFSVEKAIEEELLHNLDGQALRAEYAQLIRSGQLDPSTTLPQFINTKYSQIAQAMTSDERSAARQLYGVEFSDDVHMAQEFVRQLIQQRHTKSITEASYRSKPVRKLLELFSRMFSRMNLSTPLQAHVANVEGFLERTYQSEMSDAHNATEQQRVKEERSKRKQQMATVKAARKKARARKQYTRDLEVLLDDKDNQNALTVLEKRIPVALSSIHWMEKGTVEYEEVFNATQDEWLKQLQAGKLLEDVPNISWFKKVAQAKAKNYLTAKQAQKRGGEYQFTSIDNMQAEGLDPAAPAATKAGEEMLQYFRDNATSIGFTDKQLLALEARYRGMDGKEAAKFIGVGGDSNVSQIIGSAMIKVRQAADSDPKIRQSLEDIVYRPAYAADPNAPSSNLPPSYKKIAKFLSKEERAKMRANTAQNIVDVFNDLPSDQNFITAARLGEAKRGWYKRASVALRQMFGGDTDQFVALLAAHSPQQSVLENLRMSLSTWTEWVNAGRPSSDAELLAIYKRVSGASLPARMGNANRALRGEGLINLSGFKVESFRKNLLGDLSAPTNDTWMALFGNVSQDIFGTKSGYLGFTAKIRRVAKKLGWEPAEVQETVWSFFKTLYEAQTAGKRAGGLIKEVTDKEVSATPEFYEYLINDEQTKEKLKQLGIDISGLKSLGRLGGRGGSSATPAVDRLGPSDRAAVRRIAQRATSLKEQRLAEQEAARSSGAAYAADPAAASSPAVKFASDVLVQLGDYKRRMFRVFDSSGGLKMPSAANADTQLNFFQPKINKDAYINSVMGEVRGENRRLKKAVKEAYGDSLNKKDVAAMNNALNGNKAELNKLPPEIGEIITTMRTQIDALSNHVVKKGWVTGELKAKIGENLGTYLARSYRIFDEADYADNIDPEVKSRAINFVEQQLRAKDSGLSASEAQLIAQRKVAEMLTEYSKDSARDMMDKGRLGEKDLGLFMKRKDIAPEIRALLGEYTDPVTNYARSISRLAHFVGNHQFLTELKKLGMGEVFFDEKDYAARRAAGADTKIAGQVFAGVKTGDAEGDVSSGSYSPLAGLYTTKEVNQILESYDSFNKMLDGGLMKWMAKVNVFTKSMKTVASVMTNVRNLLGQPYFLLANGHNPFAFRKAHKALKAVWADAAGNSKEFQVYFNKMTRLGLVGEEITTSELRRVMGEFGSELDNAENASELLDKGTGKLLKGVKQTYAAMTRIYRASDEIGKIVHFELEKEALRPIRPEATEVELEAEAAERTRGGVPTYSMLPPTVQRIRTQPFVGPFMSFFYEAARTQVMNVKYATEEWKNGNHAYASRRIGGHLAATVGMGYVLQLASKALFGISDEEEEGFREFLRDYEKDSQFIFWRDKEGQLQYTNISYNNPYSATTDKLLAMSHISGRPEDSIAKNIAIKTVEMLDPFTSETIAAQAVLNIHSNKDSYGNKLWNEQANTEDKVAAAVSHAAKALTPATIERAWNKWRPAYQGKHLPKSARVPVLGDELLAEVTGFRIRTMDYEDAMLHSSFNAASSISESNRIFNQTAGRGGVVTDAEMLDAYEKANEARFRNFQQMSKKVRAAQLGGVKRGKVLSTMKTGKMSASDISYILNEKFRPMSPSPQIIKKARDKGHAIPMQAINEIKRRWRNTPLFEDGE